MAGKRDGQTAQWTPGRSKMKQYAYPALALTLLFTALPSYGLAMEIIGPDSVREHATFDQTFWPTGIVELLRHESRVYSRCVNGNDNIYFNANPEEINTLIRLFSEARMRDHELHIKTGKESTRSFKKDPIPYNASLQINAGIALFFHAVTKSPRPMNRC